MIEVGDVVEATMNGGQDRNGLPIQYPITGRVYRVTSIYEMPYGLGCTLYGMDPSPYRGYFLFVQGERRKRNGPRPGWYFTKASGDNICPELAEILKKPKATRHFNLYDYQKIMFDKLLGGKR